jgi:hypothetical protein
VTSSRWTMRRGNAPSSFLSVRLQPAGLRRTNPEGVASLCLVLVLLIAACGSEGKAGPAAPEDIFLPRLTDAPPHHPAAAIEGTLVEDRGCLELKNLYLSAELASPSPHAVVLLLWPEGSRATRTAAGGLRVDAPDLPVASTGQRLFVGGMSHPRWQTRSRRSASRSLLTAGSGSTGSRRPFTPDTSAERTRTLIPSGRRRTLSTKPPRPGTAHPSGQTGNREGGTNIPLEQMSQVRLSAVQR